MQSLTAIAHTTRRHLVELLEVHDRPAGELVEEFDPGTPAISRHVHVLCAAGLVVTRGGGQTRAQLLDPTGFDELAAALQTHAPLLEPPARRLRARAQLTRRT